MFRECMEQCMMISVLPGAVHQVFRGINCSQCPAGGMYCTQGLVTTENRVGSPLVNHE